MNARDRGFLLLSSHLGDPQRRILTPPQLRTLAQRMSTMEKPKADRELETGDLVALGYTREMADRIVALLAQEEQLDYYLKWARRAGCGVVTRADPRYPLLLRQRLGMDSPGCLWTKGDETLLNTPTVALVGSRDLREENRCFAEAVGVYAARQGLTLVSGNARGADKAAQESCLRAGGNVISFVADALEKQNLRQGILYVSEDGIELPFSAQRAISRNRCIHAMGRMVFVAQATLEKGGTWDGTVKNLRQGISTVACFRDGSRASLELERMGAYLIGLEDLTDLTGLTQENMSFLDR